MRSDGTAVATRRPPGVRRPAVNSDPESSPPLRGGPHEAEKGGGRRRPEPATEGGAAKHLRGVLHVRYRSVIRAQLGLVIRREGLMIPLHKPGCGSDQVYLCLAYSAVSEGSAHQATVTVWHTLQLDIRSKVADQSAGQTEGDSRWCIRRSPECTPRRHAKGSPAEGLYVCTLVPGGRGGAEGDPHRRQAKALPLGGPGHPHARGSEALPGWHTPSTPVSRLCGPGTQSVPPQCEPRRYVSTPEVDQKGRRRRYKTGSVAAHTMGR